VGDRGEHEHSGWWPEGRAEQGGAESGPRAPDAKDAGSPPSPPPPRPPRGLESRDRPKAASRYSTFVGLAFLVLVVVAILNAIGSEESGIAGIDPDDRRGEPVAEFAVPDILAGVEADANVAQDDCESSRNPCPSGEVREPACEVDAEGAIRVCDLFDKPLAISFWFTRGGDCLPAQDAFDQVASERGDEVNFLSINVLDDAADVEEIVRARGWEVPVGHDRDGAVSNLFGVGVCPTIVLAYPGGIVHEARIREGTPAEIDEMVAGLMAASERREPGGADE
jgi:thiol-disulfide isomerase/thioredoxin